MLLVMVDANNRAEIPWSPVSDVVGAVMDAARLPGFRIDALQVRTDEYQLTQASSEADGFEYLVVYGHGETTLTLSFTSEAERDLYCAAVRVARERRP